MLLENLSVDNKNELFRLFEESFATGQVPEDWSYSYLKPIPKPGKDPSMLSGYLIFIMQTTTGRLMERIVARRLAQDLDLERRNVLPPKTRRVQNKKNPWINAARFTYDVYDVSGRGGRSGGCLQQSAIQTAAWRQLDAHKMAHSSTP